MSEEKAMQPAQSSAFDPAREPSLTLFVNGQKLVFPWKWTRLAIFHSIPAWLRDSKVRPPDPEPGEESGLTADMAMLLRSGFKNLVRPFLPKLIRTLYRGTVQPPKGRDDVMPVLVLMLIDFCLGEARQHPMDVTYDEATGIVTSVRPRQRVAASSDAAKQVGRADTGRADSAK